jgi:Protein of unknown function (DUF3667)
MKHHLRKNKTCLNCGTIVEDRYCSHCGQENIEVKESFGHLLNHFFADITHYDSKFFVTIRDLIFRPGFLTKEYLAGKRSYYLHPIRMYVFISAVYFLVLLTYKSPEHQLEEATTEQVSNDTKREMADSLHVMLATASPDTRTGKIKDSLIRSIIARLRLDSVRDKKDMNFVVVGNITYKQLRQYDSVQNTLPAAKRDKGLKPWIYGHWLATLNRHGSITGIQLGARTQHMIPKLMFFFLPLFALFLKLFYSKKKYFYTDHAIFSLHFHCAVFLLFLIFDLLGMAIPALGSYVGLLEFLLAVVYLVIALRNVYEQSWLVSISKAIALSVIYSLVIGVGIVVVALVMLL